MDGKTKKMRKKKHDKNTHLEAQVDGEAQRVVGQGVAAGRRLLFVQGDAGAGPKICVGREGGLSERGERDE
jgi:hypothetical protein